MEYRQLWWFYSKVSALSFGTHTFGGGDAFFLVPGGIPMSLRQAAKLIFAWQAGVNPFDTADVYSGGLSEEVFGKGDCWTARSVADFNEGNLPHG